MVSDRIGIHGNGIAVFECVEIDNIHTGINQDAPFSVPATMYAGNCIIGITSNEEAPVNGLALCVKGRYGYDFVHHPERLKRPQVRRYLLDDAPRPKDRGEWVEVDWDTALDITAHKLRTARDIYGPDSVGLLTSAKCLNEENYLMNKFARQVIGTNNIDHCARL